jgi:FtsZ-interacting cell division protein ZipA
MADLRWILLLGGLLFLAGLAAWELRRPRQGRRDGLGPPERSEPQLGQIHDFGAEPSPVRTAAPSHSLIPPLGSPLVISLDSPPEPVKSCEPPVAPVAALPEVDRDTQAAAAQAAAETETEPLPGVQPGEIVVPLIVEWPPEDQRHIISVRVVAANPERLSGRPLRQALAACGFVHGRFSIFHQPGADGRALISAANLSKPGVFDPVSMDFQRFRGLGLFTVLPGPLAPAAALDHLLDTASDLAERLQARLQDEHGEPLDEVRLQALARTVQNISTGALRAEPAA